MMERHIVLDTNSFPSSFNSASVACRIEAFSISASGTCRNG